MKKSALKFGVFILMSIVFIGFFAGVVSAQASGGGLDDIVNKIGEFLETIFKFLIGPSAGSEELFIRVLLFILVLTIVALAVNKIPNIGENKLVSFVISLIVSIISIRYLLVGDIILLWLPYSVFGITLTSLLPFIILFFFIQGFDYSAIRKVGWTTFLVIFIALAILRWDALALAAPGKFNPAWIYLVIAVISGLLIVFDRKVHAIFAVRGILRLDTDDKRARAMDLARQIREKNDGIATATNDTERKNLQKQRDNLEKNMAALFK